jgi:hypothetical protein
LVAFKLLGFILHMTMMHLWYTGPILGILLWTRGGHPRMFTRRLILQMPIIVALGINFGIIPLLFVQVAYYKVFYPSTILMAWPWISVIVLLTFAYYGVYIYATAMKADIPKLTLLTRTAGGISALLFVAIGFIFANEFSLMTNLGAWGRIWSQGNVGGAAVGTALNTADPALWPRWLLMFGMALTTASAYIAIDSGFLGRNLDAGYRRWAAGFAYKPYIVGLLWFGCAALWYMFGTWSRDIRSLMFSGNWAILTGLTAIIPVVTLIMLIVAARKNEVSRGTALVIGLAQFLVLAFNAMSRQVVQNAELGRYFDITAETVRTQWGPMILFLAVFVVGLGIAIWMLRQTVVAREDAASQ